MTAVSELEYREFLGTLKAIGIDTNDLDQMLAYRRSFRANRWWPLALGISLSVVGLLTLIFFIGLFFLAFGIYVLWSVRRKLNRQAALLDHHWQVMQWPAMP
jgi:hypothetical protein